jgi:hypothetical protein
MKQKKKKRNVMAMEKGWKGPGFNETEERTRWFMRRKPDR